MTMNELPVPCLEPEQAGNTDRYSAHLLASGNLCLSALHLRYAREFMRYVLLDEFDVGIPSVAILGCGDGQSCLNVLATSTKRTKGITKCYVFRRAEQLKVPTLVPLKNRS